MRINNGISLHQEELNISVICVNAQVATFHLNTKLHTNLLITTMRKQPQAPTAMMRCPKFKQSPTGLECL